LQKEFLGLTTKIATLLLNNNRLNKLPIDGQNIMSSFRNELEIKRKIRIKEVDSLVSVISTDNDD